MRNSFVRLMRYYEKFTHHDLYYKYSPKLNRFSSLQLSTVSAAMAYYMTMAIFPFIIFLVTVLVYLSRRISLPLETLQELTAIIPAPVWKVLKPVLEEITKNYHFSMISLGALSILWASSRGWDTFIHTMDEIYEQETRNYFLKKLWGILFVVLLVLGIILLLLGVSFGNLLLHKLYTWTDIALFNHRLLTWGRIALPFLFVFLLLALLYHWMSRRQDKLRYSFFAALLPTLFWVLISWGLSWYIENFTKFSLIYGSLMGIILLSFWLYLIMQFVMLGAFLHSEILNYKERQRELVFGEPSKEKEEDESLLIKLEENNGQIL